MQLTVAYTWAKNLLRWLRLWPEVPLPDGEGVSACELLQKAVWGDNPRCMRCKSTNVHKTNLDVSNQQWKCRTCKKPFNIRTNTIMENSRVDLDDWITVVSSVQSTKPVWGEVARINRQTECTYATTAYMVEKVKNEMNKDPFLGEISNVLGMFVRNKKKWGNLKRRKKDGFYAEPVYWFDKERKLPKGAKNRHINPTNGHHYTKGPRRKKTYRYFTR